MLSREQQAGEEDKINIGLGLRLIPLSQARLYAVDALV